MDRSIPILEFQEYVDLAHTILHKDTAYLRAKNIIADLFGKKRKNRFETIIFRLTIIDSYYSTQMNKRFFGLDDLAEKLLILSDDDESLKSMALEYLVDPMKSIQISMLFYGKYGIRKTGHEVGQAVSLISKYLYFLTDFQFPIYDNLVRISYPLIQKRYPEFNLSSLEKTPDSFFKNIKELNEISGINDFNKLDNFLWLMGKLTEGSLSLILNKPRYLKLIEKIKITQGIKSKETDEKIRKYLKSNIDYLNGIFDEDETQFIKYIHANSVN